MSKNLAEEQLHTARAALLGAYPSLASVDAVGMPVKRVLCAVFRWKMPVFAAAVLGCLVGSFLAMTTPNTYVSQGAFLFTASGSESIHVDLTRSSENKADAIAANAVHVLMADNLLRRVVERVGPEEIMKPYQPADGPKTGVTALLHSIQRDWNAVDEVDATPDEALKTLRKHLRVERSRMADVLTVAYSAHDWRLARDLLSVYMEEAQRWHQEQYDDPKIYDEVKKRAEEAAVARAVGNRHLREFLEREAKVQSTFEFELERLRQAEADAKARVEENRLAVEGMFRQIAELEKRLKTLPPTMVVHRRLDTSSTVEGIQQAISELEVRRANVRVTSVQGDEIKAIDDKIANLKTSLRLTLEEASKAPAYDLEVTNPEYTSATEQLGRLRNELVLAQAIVGQLQKNHAEVSTQLRRLLDLEPRYQQLHDGVVRAEEDARSAADALAKAELKRQLQIGNFSSLKVIDSASTPLDKEGPDRLKLVLGGLIVGLFFGLGLVILRSVPDRTVRMPEDLEKLEGLTVVGVMPRLDNRNVRRHLATRMRGW